MDNLAKLIEINKILEGQYKKIVLREVKLRTLELMDRGMGYYGAISDVTDILDRMIKELDR